MGVGKFSTSGTLLIDESGHPIAFFLGQSVTMVRNYVVDELVDTYGVYRNEALNIVDRKYSFDENIPVMKYTPSVRKTKEKK